MSAPAQVTEAHIALSARITRENGYDPESAWNRPHVLRDAQYIADSEAKALSSLAMVAAGSADRNVSLRLENDQLLQQVANLTYSNDSHRETAERWRAAAIERDQLRAETERLTAACDKFSNSEIMQGDWKARAERAEAELAGIRALADRRNKRYHVEDTTHQLVAALDQALDIAQAELAQLRELDAERARMRQIAVDKRIRTPTPRTDEEAGSLIDAEEVVPADFARELERELAKERARLDYLSTRGFEHRHHETGDHLGYEWTISSYSESEDVTLRDVIDAEMQEEAK